MSGEESKQEAMSQSTSVQTEHTSVKVKNQEHPIQVYLATKSLLSSIDSYPLEWTVHGTVDDELFRKMVECVENMHRLTIKSYFGETELCKHSIVPRFIVQVPKESSVPEESSVPKESSTLKEMSNPVETHDSQEPDSSFMKIEAGTVLKPDLDMLMKYAKPAPFGKGSETVLDTDVRLAYELDGNILKIDEEMSKKIKNICYIVSNRLMVDVEARFYKMHIYPTGGHFEEHRDTVHDKNHIGTLVVELPVEHKGGELHVDNKILEKPKRDNCITYAAFFNDVPHHVATVTSGTRVVLQYDLYQLNPRHVRAYELSAPKCWDSDEREDEMFEHQKGALHSPSTKLLELVKEYFEDDENAESESLGFVLGHEYPLCYLDPSTLKGADRDLYLTFRDHYDLECRSVLVDIETDGNGTWDSVSAIPFDLDDIKALEKMDPLPWNLNERKKVLESNLKKIPPSRRQKVHLVPPHSSAETFCIEHQSYIEHTGNESQMGSATYFSGVLVVTKRDRPNKKLRTD